VPIALLETKLYVPRSRRALVLRSRLSERLDRGTASKLVLVSAPAGFGKTTLLDHLPLRLHVVIAARVLEASMIFAGVVSLLSLVTLRHDLGGAAGADAASLVTAGASHVAVYNWTFLLGQSLMPGINALLLGSLMYRSRLVPRLIPVMGLIGAPLLIACVFATLFGSIEQGSALTAAAALPVAAWELSLGVWLVVKGFRPSPITAEIAAVSTPAARQDVTV
jgi:hypothetical protein